MTQLASADPGYVCIDTENHKWRKGIQDSALVRHLTAYGLVRVQRLTA